MRSKMELVSSSIYEGLMLKGLKRYYVEDLTDRDYILENTTPYMITLLDKTIEDHSWGSMLVKVVDLLLEYVQKSKEELISFKTNRCNKSIFSFEPKVNCKPLKCGLFLDCNNTAQLSCWLLQDILDFFEIDRAKVQFIIHRTPAAEPKEVKNHIRSDFEKGFKKYLIEFHQKSYDETETIINIIEKLNKVLANQSPSYNDFFLFDEYQYAYNYCKKVKDLLESRLPYNDRRKYIEALEYIVKYYSYIDKELKQ